MNWFTKVSVSEYSEERKKQISEGLDNLCEHVEQDYKRLSCVVRENDSFGSESTGLCQACVEANEKEEDEEKHTCRDCSAEFSLSQGGTLWKWYDFYAAQGDEPVPICKDCRTKPVHLARIRKDREDEDWEFGRLPNNESEDSEFGSEF